MLLERENASPGIADEDVRTPLGKLSADIWLHEDGSRTGGCHSLQCRWHKAHLYWAASMGGARLW